jgi:hypothetical protein
MIRDNHSFNHIIYFYKSALKIRIDLIKIISKLIYMRLISIKIILECIEEVIY